MSMSKMSMSKNFILTDGGELGDRIHFGTTSQNAILDMSDEEIRKYVALLQMEYTTHFIDCEMPNQMAYHRVLKALGLWRADWKHCTCK